MRADALGLQQLGFDCSDDFPCDLVLQGKDVGQVAVVAVGPDVIAGRGVDQLGGDAHAIAALAHAALQHVTHAEFARDALYVDRLALVGERRIARDDEEPAQLRQTGDDVLGNAVGEIFLLRVAAHVGERQYGDRWSIGSSRLRSWRRPRHFDRDRCGVLDEGDAVDADRPRDVLDRLLAHVLETEVELVAHLVVDIARNHDAARLGERFQPRRHVDAVAVDIVARR